MEKCFKVEKDIFLKPKLVYILFMCKTLLNSLKQNNLIPLKKCKFSEHDLFNFIFWYINLVDNFKFYDSRLFILYNIYLILELLEKPWYTNFSVLFYRGEANFPDLLGSSSKVWPLHSSHNWPNEMNNSNNLEKPTTVKYAIRPANDNRFVFKISPLFVF